MLSLMGPTTCPFHTALERPRHAQDEHQMSMEHPLLKRVLKDG